MIPLPVEIIPGITSFQAAAARTRTILCESHETLCIIPGIRDEESLTQTLEQADSAVILKAYRNFPAIVSSLRRSGRLEGGLMASHVEQPEERLAPVTTVAAEEGTPPYMSLVLSRKNNPVRLPQAARRAVLPGVYPEKRSLESIRWLKRGGRTFPYMKKGRHMASFFVPQRPHGLQSETSPGTGTKSLPAGQRRGPATRPEQCF